jgi:arsenate reductase (thioredoxin)
MESQVNVLFLCTHNSARSILAEALLNHLGQPRFKGYSAGSHPGANQQPHHMALQVLREAGISTAGLHSKNWNDFALDTAPRMDLIITVCDNAAGEVCPSWPGRPATAHWGYPDPSEGDAPDAEKLRAFQQTLQAIEHKLQWLISLPNHDIRAAVFATAAATLMQ